MTIEQHDLACGLTVAEPSPQPRAHPCAPITVGLAMFSTTDQGTNWAIITAATLLSTAPLVIAFLLFQRQFVQSFMRTARS